MKLIHNLEKIKQAELDKEEENFHFKAFLRHQNSNTVDSLVHELNDTVTPQIDCTLCGNCCKSLMINITETESEKLAAHLKMTLPDVTEKYIETGIQGQMILNAIPCHFLAGTMCSIYEHRFAGCREFPGLNQAGFTGRLFSTFMHYGRCLITYNVIEQLKKELGFSSIH